MIINSWGTWMQEHIMSTFLTTLSLLGMQEPKYARQKTVWDATVQANVRASHRERMPKLCKNKRNCYNLYPCLCLAHKSKHHVTKQILTQCRFWPWEVQMQVLICARKHTVQSQPQQSPLKKKTQFNIVWCFSKNNFISFNVLAHIYLRHLTIMCHHAPVFYGGWLTLKNNVWSGHNSIRASRVENCLVSPCHKSIICAHSPQIDTLVCEGRGFWAVERPWSCMAGPKVSWTSLLLKDAHENHTSSCVKLTRNKSLITIMEKIVKINKKWRKFI